MNLRRTSARVLVRVIGEGQSLTAALDCELSSIHDGKDRSFIQALSYGVCRQYDRLEFILGKLLKKPLRNKDVDIKVLLLMGIYQLRYMRVKSHAAVSETVAAVNRKTWAKSLVNGVLREFIREQDVLENLADKSKQAKYSHPGWMIDKFEHCWPQAAEQILHENNRPAPMVMRVNLQRQSRADYLKQLEEKGIAGQPLVNCDSAVLLDEPQAVEKLPGFYDGCVSVQDAAAQLAAQLLEVEPGQKVLDMCAAPGGKTSAILERYPDIDSLLAVDIDEGRLFKVKENLERLKLRAELLVADVSALGEWSKNRQFERILLDAPCSASGVIRRHPDIKLLRRESDIAALQNMQKKMLAVAWQLLAPGGVLLYATCSVLKQENEEQIALFLTQNSQALEYKIATEWGMDRPFGRQIMTGAGYMDGFYYARLRKPL